MGDYSGDSFKCHKTAIPDKWRISVSTARQKYVSVFLKCLTKVGACPGRILQWLVASLVTNCGENCHEFRQPTISLNRFSEKIIHFFCHIFPAKSLVIHKGKENGAWHRLKFDTSPLKGRCTAGEWRELLTFCFFKSFRHGRGGASAVREP